MLDGACSLSQEKLVSTLITCRFCPFTQAMTAKAVMGNINMDGRVLRVEWSDCRKVEDMFSTVLFIDRIPREGPHVCHSCSYVGFLYYAVRCLPMSDNPLLISFGRLKGL